MDAHIAHEAERLVADGPNVAVRFASKTQAVETRDKNRRRPPSTRPNFLVMIHLASAVILLKAFMR